MGEAASLLTAIAAVITAVGGATAAIIVALTGMRRQRHSAAEEASRLIRGEDRDPPRHRHRVTRGHLGGEAELAVLAAEMARDARELALDTRRDGRLDALEARDQPDPSDDAHDSGGEPSAG